MSLVIENVNLIRTEEVSIEDADAFLLKAVGICGGGAPDELEWLRVNRMERGNGRALEHTTTETWQTGVMIEVRRVCVETFQETDDGVKSNGNRVSYDIRGFPDEGSMVFRIDNTRLKGASMEVFSSVKNTSAVAALFREAFAEA